MVQTKCKFNKSHLFLKLFCIRAEKLETKSIIKKQENFKNGKVRFRLNNDVRKEKEDYDD